MNDEPPRPEPPPMPLPDVYELPQEAIDRWNSITTARPLLVPFSKHQLDNLMVGLRQVVMSQMALGDTLNYLTMNDMSKAKTEFRRHQELSRFAYSNFNWFISHVMTSAVPDEVDNG